MATGNDPRVNSMFDGIWETKHPGIRAAVRARDAAIVLIAANGKVEGEHRLAVWRDDKEELIAALRTPFGGRLFEVTPEQIKRWAEKQFPLPRRDELAWGLDVWWQKKKVLNFEWSEAGNEVRVVSLKKGEWQAVLQQLVES